MRSFACLPQNFLESLECHEVPWVASGFLPRQAAPDGGWLPAPVPRFAAPQSPPPTHTDLRKDPALQTLLVMTYVLVQALLHHLNVGASRSLQTMAPPPFPPGHPSAHVSRLPWRSSWFWDPRWGATASLSGNVGLHFGLPRKRDPIVNTPLWPKVEVTGAL